jgi:CubicO group peptidase (beta-lactamase class C family)
MARGGKVFAHQAAGRLAYKPDSKSFAVDSIKCIASITKTITATAVMKLVENGALWLEQPVKEVIKEFAIPMHEGISIRHLLTHTSGLTADHGYFTEPYPLNLREAMEHNDWLTKAILTGPLQSKPGKHWAYCSLGFMVLAEIVSRVSGVHYNEFVEKKIFAPLGMTRTFLEVPENLCPEVSLMADWDEQNLGRSALRKGPPNGGGGVYSTLHDLFVFGQATMNGGIHNGTRILGKKTVSEMTRNQLSGVPAFHWVRDIESVVSKAKQAGFYVMVKPHVSMTDKSDNRNIMNTPTEAFSPSAFFPDWTSYLLDMAAIATANGVDAICIGTEMNNMDWRYKDRWVELIAALRREYAGELTYDASFALSRSWKGFDDVVFWDELDFIGCSLYVQISRDDGTDVETLRGRWRDDPIGEIRDVIGYLKGVAYRHGKRFMALESGYPSIDGSLFILDTTPAAGKTVNEDAQRRGLEAYLSAMFENRGNWLRGVSLWDITPNMLRPEMLKDPWHLQGYSVYGKKAAATVKQYFGLSW